MIEYLNSRVVLTNGHMHLFFFMLGMIVDSVFFISIKR